MAVPDQDPLEAFEDAARRLAAVRAQSRANVQLTEKLATDARSASAVARSPRGEVTVAAKAGGVLTDLQITDAAYDLDPDALAQMLMRVIARAQHDAAMAFADAASGALGEDSPVAATLRSNAQDAFPDPEES